MCQPPEFLISKSLSEEGLKTATTITMCPLSPWGKSLVLFSRIKRDTIRAALQKILLLSETLTTRITLRMRLGQSCSSLMKIKLLIQILSIRNKLIKKKMWNNLSLMSKSKRVSKIPSKTSSTISLRR